MTNDTLTTLSTYELELTVLLAKEGGESFDNIGENRREVELELALANLIERFNRHKARYFIVEAVAEELQRRRYVLRDLVTKQRKHKAHALNCALLNLLIHINLLELLQPVYNQDERRMGRRLAYVAL